MRVLHSVAAFIGLSENWIYPQIVQVPGTDSRVICSAVTHAEIFPIEKRRLIVSPPPWNAAFGIPRLLNGIGRRVGLGGFVPRTRIRRWGPQVIHAHFGMRGVECLALQRTLKVPLITSFYGYDAWRLPKSEPVWEKRYHELFTVGAAFLVEGPAMRDRLIHLGCSSEKIRIQRIGVNLSTIPFIPTTISSPLRIIMIGRLIEKKGMVDGLRACLEARSRGVDLEVTIIGDAEVGDTSAAPVKKQLLKLASEPQLAGHVEFTGFLSMAKTRDVIRAHHIFLCPSKHIASGDAEGGSPVALTEAMAAGLLCIGTRHCDIPEVIIDLKTGYLVDESDVAAIADILCAVANRHCPVDQLNRAGRAHIEENFALPKQMLNLRAAYEDIVTAQPKTPQYGTMTGDSLLRSRISESTDGIRR